MALSLHHGQRVMLEHVVLQAITLKSYPAELSLAAPICAAGTLQNGIVTVIAERGDTAAWRLHWDAGLVTMVYGGVICSGLGYYLWGIIMKQKGPVFVTAFNPLSMGRVLGAVVIIAGLYLVIWGKSKDPDTKDEGDQFPSANQQNTNDNHCHTTGQ
ncbi:Drug/metabolite transporter [Artemisia annua]|uniref:Drug/metabolite transporter n=1 Tax=Artemisia annua TaxID=35608 RepID=A0A2U1KPQ5_ARTAN|nr:Drug/metabolite transporter [Artemisia annua]